MTLENRNKKQEKTAAFLTLGCKVNSYETDGMEKLLKEAGYEIKEFCCHASVYIVNTCTVTNIADRKSRQMLHKAKKLNPDAIVVAVGCYAQAAKEILEKDEAIDIVIGNNQKKNIVEVIEQYQIDNSQNEAVIDIAKVKEYEELNIESVGEKTRVYIKIQDGCNQFCSYCIIPYARGRVRSRRAEDVVAEVQAMTAKGYKEVVLTGIHLSSYGINMHNNGGDAMQKTEELPTCSMLLNLILRISKIEGIERIRLGSLEPRIITEEFVRQLSAQQKVCPHFHLSLQSGCNATLRRMNRRYTAEEYYEKCELIRRYFDHPAITTDVITGFPGETEEEFKECRDFLRKVSFSQMHIFKYSKRKGTKAEIMPDQVAEQVKHERSASLIELDNRMNQEYKKNFMGKIEKILVEEEIVIEGTKYQVGHNERYLKIAFIHEESVINQIVEVEISGDLTNEILFSQFKCEFLK